LKDALRFLAPVGLALIVGAGARFVLQGQLDLVGQGLLAAGAVLILAYLLAFPGEAVRVVGPGRPVTVPIRRSLLRRWPGSWWRPTFWGPATITGGTSPGPGDSP